MIVASEGSATQNAICGCEEGYELSVLVHACYKSKWLVHNTGNVLNKL